MLFLQRNLSIHFHANTQTHALLYPIPFRIVVVLFCCFAVLPFIIHRSFQYLVVPVYMDRRSNAAVQFQFCQIVVGKSMQMEPRKKKRNGRRVNCLHQCGNRTLSFAEFYHWSANNIGPYTSALEHQAFERKMISSCSNFFDYLLLSVSEKNTLSNWIFCVCVCRLALQTTDETAVWGRTIFLLVVC